MPFALDPPSAGSPDTPPSAGSPDTPPSASGGFVLAPPHPTGGFVLAPPHPTGGFTPAPPVSTSDEMRDMLGMDTDAPEATLTAAGRLGQWAGQIAEAAPGFVARTAENFATLPARVAGSVVGGGGPFGIGASPQYAAATPGEMGSMTANLPSWLAQPLNANQQAFAEGAAGANAERQGGIELAANSGNPWWARAIGLEDSASPFTLGTVGNAANAMMPGENVKAGIIQNGVIPGAMNLTHITDAAGALGSALRPDTSTPTKWPVTQALWGTATSPEVASQVPGAALGAWAMAGERLAGGALGGEKPGPPSLDLRGGEPPANPVSGRPGFLPTGNWFDRAMSKARQSDIPAISGPANFLTGGRDVLRDRLAKEVGDPQADAAMTGISKANNLKTSIDNYSRDFQAQVDTLAPLDQRRLGLAMQKVPLPDSTLHDILNGGGSDKGIASQQAEKQTYDELKQAALTNYDIMHPPIPGDATGAKVRDLFGQYAANHLINELYAGYHETQPGFEQPQAMSMFRYQGDSPQYRKQAPLGADGQPMRPGAAEQTLRTNPANYAAPLRPDEVSQLPRELQPPEFRPQDRAMLKERDQGVLRDVNAKIAQGSLAQSDLPPLPGPGDKVLTPGERAAYGVQPEDKFVATRATDLRNALKPWVGDPVMGKVIDDASSAIARGGSPTKDQMTALMQVRDVMAKRIGDSSKIADQWQAATEELQRQVKQAGTAYAYKGNTVENISRNLVEARNALTRGDAGQPANRFSNAPDATVQRKAGVNETPINDPGYMSRVADSMNAKKAGFRVMMNTLRGGPFEAVADSPESAKALEARGWQRLSDDPKVWGDMAGHYVAGPVMEALRPYDTSVRPEEALKGVQAIMNMVYRYHSIGSLSAVQRNTATMIQNAWAHLGITPEKFGRLLTTDTSMTTNDPDYARKFKGMDVGMQSKTLLAERNGYPDPSLRPTSTLGNDAIANKYKQLDIDAKALAEKDGSMSGANSIAHLYRAVSTAIGNAATKVGGAGMGAALSSESARNTFGQIEVRIRQNATRILMQDNGLSFEQASELANQAFGDYSNKSAAAQLGRKLGGLGVGNPYLHWPMAMAGNTARLLSSGNPIIMARAAALPLSALGWSLHLNNMQDAMYVAKAMQAQPDAPDKKKQFNDAIAASRAATAQAGRDVPDWDRGAAPLTNFKASEGGQPKVQNMVDVSGTDAYESPLEVVNGAVRLHQMLSDWLRPGEQGGDGKAATFLGRLGDAASGALVPDEDPTKPAFGPTNQMAKMSAGLNILAPPQISQAAELGKMEERRGSVAWENEMGTAPDEKAILARAVGLFQFWQNSPMFQEMRGAQDIQAAGSAKAFNPMRSKDTSLDDSTAENVQYQPQAIEGAVKYHFGPKPQ